MTEQEKMLRGLSYHAEDASLSRQRLRAKELCYRFQMLSPLESEKRQEILRALIGKMGEDCFITGPFWCDYGCNLTLGDRFYANHNLVILDCAEVRFGDDVLVGPNCGFYTAAHPLDAEQRKRGLEFARPIVVGNGVWFGGGVQVLPGVRIGDRAVIGAGSVVTRDIPPNCLAVGNPCKVLHEILPEHEK